MASLKQRLVAYEDASSSSASSTKRANPTGDAPALSIKERMSAFQQGLTSSGTAPATESQDAPPTAAKTASKWSTLKDRMAVYQQMKEDSLQDTKCDDAPKARPKMKLVNLQERLAMFEGASSSSASEKKKVELSSVGSLAKYRERFEELAAAKQEEEANSYQTRKIGGGSSLIKQRMAMLSEIRKDQSTEEATREGRGRDMKEFRQRLLAFSEAIESKNPAGEDHDTPSRRALRQGSDFQQRLSKFAEASSSTSSIPPAFADGMSGAINEKKLLFEGKDEGEMKSNGNPADKSGNILHERRMKFEETTGPDDVEKKQLSLECGNTLQERMAKMEGALSAKEYGTSHREFNHSESSVHERLVKFEGASSHEAPEGNDASLPAANHSGASLKERKAAFEKGSTAESSVQKSQSPDDGKNDPGKVSQHVSEGNSLQTGEQDASHNTGASKDSLEEPLSSPTIDPQEEVETGEEENNEHTSKLADSVTKDDEYLYDLAINFNRLQLKQKDVPHPKDHVEEGEVEPDIGQCDQMDVPHPGNDIAEGEGENRTEQSGIEGTVEEVTGEQQALSHASTNTLEEESKENNHPDEETEEAQDGEADVNTSVEGATDDIQDTESTNWLNQEWICQHLTRDGKYNSLEFRLDDRTLFANFDEMSEKRKGDLVNTFVKQLLLHANGITHLDLSGSLIPDEFLVVLAEELLKDPAVSLPKLQLLNLESNMLRGRGIEALSTAIANKSAWKYLQVLLLGGQKHRMSSQAGNALAHALGRSASPIVVCSASMSDQLQNEIDEALLYNQFLLFCATGTLFGVEVDSLDVFTNVDLPVSSAAAD